MKLYLKIDDTTDDTLISALIKAAVNTAEKYMNLDLLTATYINYRDDAFEEQDLTLRRGPYQSLTKIEYRSNGSYIEVDSGDYDIASGGIYGRIYSIEISGAMDEHPEALKITFKTGYGDTASSIPEDIINAIKAHVAYLYENRGDISEETMVTIEKAPLPLSCMVTYNNYKIVDCSGVI